MIVKTSLFTDPSFVVRVDLLPLMLLLLLLSLSRPATAEFGGKIEHFQIFDRDRVKVIELKAVKGWDFTHEVS